MRYLLLICFFMLPIFVFGQTGKIVGKVIDGSTNEALPFVNIILEGTSIGAASNLDGEYIIVNVPPGAYNIKASAIGFNSVTIQNIKVATGLTTTQNFSLVSTSIQLDQDVVVIAEKPMINKDITASTSIVGEDLIAELPVTEVSDLLQLQAGIVVGGGGEIHLRGGRAGQISYQIDGVPVTDAYDNSNVVDVGTNSVKELQVISGAFNAEYGQALSGVVNIVTKDGNNKYTGSLSSYVGDYISNKNDVFWNIKDLNPVAIRNFEGSLSGPIINDKFFFFANARYFYNTGYLYGQRKFLTTDISRENTTNNSFFITDATDSLGRVKTPGGDNEYVAMNWNERIFGQGKLTYRLLPGMTVRFSYLLDWQDYQDYDGGMRLTPDNNLQRFRRGVSNTFSINHAVSDMSFYTLNLSYFYKDYRHYLYEDIYTGNAARPTNYIDNRLKQNPPYSFEIGGTNTNRFVRNTGTYSAKLDWETQVNKEISIKFGGEYKMHRIYFENINLIPLNINGQDVRPFNVVVPSPTSLNYDTYTRKPQEASAYVQSKFEAFNLIFNAGVRFDLFNPDGKILADPTDPDILKPVRPANQGKTLAERRAYWYKDAGVKTQISPRLGIAFPITDRGVIHFSYGHFFQLPGYELLYTNPDFKVVDGSGNVGLMGNSDLEPQKTVKGEIGLQQQLSDDMAVDITMFFEDFRNLTGTQTQDITIFGTQSTYSQYANSDFGFSKGFIVKFEKRFGGGLAVNLDYTFSVTKGNASNPADARNAVLGGAAPETFIAPLDWDQTHTLNATVAYSVPNDFGLSLIVNYFTGQPYTPAVNKNTRVTQNAFPRNSGYKPDIFNIDLRAYKDLAFGDFKFTVFLRVFNLLDLDNPRGLFSDTGDPYFTFGLLEARKINPTLYYNTLDDLFNNPTFFSEPRRIELGLSYNF
ncbi:MAG: TonB-dependent receptor [Ignavibacteriaceae bacterium]|nr:TonB-dependent receptor [Ignavibacteriaceae bacterium]